MTRVHLRSILYPASRWPVCQHDGSSKMGFVLTHNPKLVTCQKCLRYIARHPLTVEHNATRQPHDR